MWAKGFLILARISNFGFQCCISFPLTIGVSDSSESSRSQIIPEFGYYEIHRKRVNIVDGWGTLTTPNGTFQTIRIKSTVYSHDSIYIDSNNEGYSIDRVETEYKWLGNGFGTPLLRIIESNLLPLRVEGFELQDRTVTFTEGWNLMPVLSNCQVDVLYIASQIQDEIEIIKPAAGNGVYWPEKSVQSLNILVPGEAYLIRVSSSCSIVFPNCNCTPEYFGLKKL